MDNLKEQTISNIGEIGIEDISAILLGEFVAGILNHPCGSITFHVEIAHKIIAVAWINLYLFISQWHEPCVVVPIGNTIDVVGLSHDWRLYTREHILQRDGLAVDIDTQILTRLLN